jgi:hypothetical protein
VNEAETTAAEQTAGGHSSHRILQFRTVGRSGRPGDVSPARGIASVSQAPTPRGIRLIPHVPGASGLISPRRADNRTTSKEAHYSLRSRILVTA